jgi:DNA-binding NarL/FixJ family response regulator
MEQDKEYSRGFPKKEINKFARTYALSERERQVLSLLVGRVTSSEEIATKLEVSRNTVRNHFQNIFHKTKTNSKTELLSLFIKSAMGNDSAMEGPSSLSPLTILYIEDDTSYGDLAKRAMQKANANGRLVLVKDGDEAVSYLNREGRFAESQDWVLPDLVLLDLNIPKRHGFDVLQFIRTKDQIKNLPVIALTTSNDPGDVTKSYDLGANSYVQKPVGFKALVEMMRTLFNYWVDVVGLPHDTASAPRA